MKKPELMSPAGYWPQLQAAIEAGADAVYFGLRHFSARAKVGFELADLSEVMRTLHHRAVKGFITFNTLVFDHELLEAERAIAAIAEAGADAIIVQDIAIAKLAKQIAPTLEVHGSTQMSITSSQGAELAKSFGCSRVVLGRELSLKDIEKIAAQTAVELEVFVHGALCVSYSGQCFSSEAWGGRSANRGQCAQACRLSYELIVDGNQKDLQDARYLLSPGDLYALRQVPELVLIGVDCFKIEGRYKDAAYVALTTQAYRKAIDEAWSQQPLSITSAEERALEQVYSRGLGPHFIAGTNHQKVVKGRAPRHRGLKIAEVISVNRESVDVRLELPLKPGDGLVFDAANWRSPDENEEGGSVYTIIELNNKLTRLEFGRGDIDFSRIRPGDWVWRSSDPQVAKQSKVYTEASTPVYTRPVAFFVVAKRGEPLFIRATSEDGFSAVVTGQQALEPAQKRALDEALLREQLGRLGGTPFHLETVVLECSEALFVPVSELNGLRRSLVEQLLLQRIQRKKRETFQVVEKLVGEWESRERKNLSPQLHVLLRRSEQLEAAIAAQPASITLDYLELYGLRPSVERVKEAGIQVRVASPRILKPSEQNIIRFLQSLEAEILVRSGGLLYDFQCLAEEERPVLSGDFSLNVANGLSARMFLEMGLQRITPTHDLNGQQIAELCTLIDATRLEPILYQHLPVFHTEHCVFCRFLSRGTDYSNCGHPCEKHRLALKDKQGRLHPVMADVGCRNTVFGAEAQVAAKHLQRWLDAGIAHYRLEFVHETPEQVEAIISAFKQALHGSLSSEGLERKLRQLAPEGITEGSLFIPQDFSHLPQLL